MPAVVCLGATPGSWGRQSNVRLFWTAKLKGDSVPVLSVFYEERVVRREKLVSSLCRKPPLPQARNKLLLLDDVPLAFGYMPVCHLQVCGGVGHCNSRNA